MPQGIVEAFTILSADWGTATAEFQRLQDYLRD
jgi:hypothetical protein